jgi:ribosome biogenesis GTPase
MPPLDTLGWNAFFADRFAALGNPALVPGRIGVEHQHVYRVLTADADLLARVAGRLRHRAESRLDYPAVGDWVACRIAANDGTRIEHVLPRKSRFARKVAGDRTALQVVAANVDTVFLTMGLDNDYSPRRLERYLALARESGASPAVVLTKADLSDDVPGRVAEIESVARGVPVHAVSAPRREGFEALRAYLMPGRTVALLGSSGVGKSTIINVLVGSDVQRTRDVRESDQRGRHTTTNRELIVLPDGGLVIDTPGMRELQLWDAAGGVEETFDDIRTLAPDCYFPDCTHGPEPRCAVRRAVEEGRLLPERLESYRKLQDELRSLAERQELLARQEKKRQDKIIHRAARKHQPRG